MAQLRATTTLYTANAIATSPREISPVRPILLVCFLLSLPCDTLVLRSGTGGDLSRAHGSSCTSHTNVLTTQTWLVPEGCGLEDFLVNFPGMVSWEIPGRGHFPVPRIFLTLTGVCWVPLREACKASPQKPKISESSERPAVAVACALPCAPCAAAV